MKASHRCVALNLEQRALPSVRRNSKMFIGQLCSDSAARRAIQETDLDQKWLVNFLNGIGFFCQGCRQRIQADGAALIFLNNNQQQLAVNFVEAVAIHFQHLQGSLSCR